MEQVAFCNSLGQIVSRLARLFHVPRIRWGRVLPPPPHPHLFLSFSLSLSLFLSLSRSHSLSLYVYSLTFWWERVSIILPVDIITSWRISIYLSIYNNCWNNYSYEIRRFLISMEYILAHIKALFSNMGRYYLKGHGLPSRACRIIPVGFIT